MRVIARMRARGTGSTLKKKNVYSVLGKPLIWWSITEAKKTNFIDEVFVWTEDKEMAEIVRECGGHVIPRTYDQVFYHGGFWNNLESDKYIKEYIISRNGSFGDFNVILNCNLCLITAEILEEMFNKLLKDQSARLITVTAKAPENLYIKFDDNASLCPIFANSKFEQYSPDLYTFGDCSITSNLRNPLKLKKIFHEVSPEVLLDVHDLDDIKLAEYYLMRRLGGEIKHPDSL